MKKSELKKILLGKKEDVLNKKKEQMENDNQYHEILANEFEKLRIALFASFSEKYYLEGKYSIDDNSDIKIKYYCYYSEKYRDNSPFFTFEIHDIKNNDVFFVSEKDLENMNENGDKVLGDIKCKFSKYRCVDSTLKGEAVPIKFTMSRGNFENIIDAIFDDDPKVRSFKKI